MPRTPSAPWEYILHIPHDPRAVTVARRTLRLVLHAHGLVALTDLAELLATELVSNAVRHTEGPAALRLSWGGGLLRLGAWDADPTPPRPPTPHLLEAEQGRGLALVGACADEWGWHPHSTCGDSGKYVWCELGAA
ncbi:ATP-binding protein [Streptomyces kunmingensis]|uniref:ATP-binding protein n=1 Tax=Streptomyces kunmingensis TaxID=68225 RepID=A0ABU6CIJ7_9ACTN|nr:ATP-binding protein [Streptomyces kunmingensis]MEB3964041.1 ATP-binding protein [Streptomyces kunmingensis]